MQEKSNVAANLMLNNRVPALVVSKILGHSNPTVTLTIYAHSTVEMQDKAVKIMEELTTPIAVEIPSPEIISREQK
jgi:integrase